MLGQVCKHSPTQPPHSLAQAPSGTPDFLTRSSVLMPMAKLLQRVQSERICSLAILRRLTAPPSPKVARTQFHQLLRHFFPTTTPGPACSFSPATHPAP